MADDDGSGKKADGQGTARIALLVVIPIIVVALLVMAVTVICVKRKRK